MYAIQIIPPYSLNKIQWHNCKKKKKITQKHGSKTFIKQHKKTHGLIMEILLSIFS